MHQPFSAIGLVDFLQAVKEKYKPKLVVCLGDEIDGHAWSFHENSIDAYSPNKELEMAITNLKPIYKLFPNVKVIHSNHGSLVYRKQRAGMIPDKAMRDYGEIIEAPKGWTWHQDLTLMLPNKQKVYVHHGIRKNAFSVAKELGMHHVCGHYHTSFKIIYDWYAGKELWSMNCGCLINDRAYAFEYAKNIKPNAKLGVGIVQDNKPLLVPMRMNNKNRWTGKL